MNPSPAVIDASRIRPAGTAAGRGFAPARPPLAGRAAAIATAAAAVAETR